MEHGPYTLKREEPLYVLSIHYRYIHGIFV